MQTRSWYGDPNQGERVIEVIGDVASCYAAGRPRVCRAHRTWVVTLVPRTPVLSFVGGVPAGLSEAKMPDAQRAYARISWGMSGGQVGMVAEVDIGHGVTVPVHGSTVYVDVFVPTNVSTAVFSAGAKLVTPTIAATCAPANGAVYAHQPLTRELYVGNLGPAEIKFAGPIPRFAKSYVVLFGGEYSGAMTVDVTEANHSGAAQNLFDRWYINASGLTVTNQPRWQPRMLPADGGALRLTSMEPTATLTDLRVLFYLAL